MREFVTYVPLTFRNRRIFSPKLAEILVAAAIQTEATFKAIIKSEYIDKDERINTRTLRRARNAIDNDKGNLSLYRNVLEPYFLLSRRRVTILRRPRAYRVIRPFSKFRAGESPRWWASYNAVKHSFYENIREATLQRTIAALAALFLIQVLHPGHRQTLVDLNVIRSGNREFDTTGLARPALKKILLSSPRKIASNTDFPNVWAETEFFEFDYYQS